MTELSTPSWLPDPIQFQGDWNHFVRTLYAVFESDFKHGTPRYKNCPVWYDRRVESGDSYEYEEGFWHLVTKDQWVWNPQTRRKEKDRLPELDRAARLPWTKPAMDHHLESGVLNWDFRQETKRGYIIRSYIWLKDHDFVVILERQKKRRGDIFQLITSFLVNYEGKRRDLQSRYERREK